MGEDSLRDYNYLCFNCGFITPYEKWYHWIWDEDGNNKIEAPAGWQDPYSRCPVCLWDHMDYDNNPGYLDGTLAALTVEREREKENWQDRWLEVESEIIGI